MIVHIGCSINTKRKKNRGEREREGTKGRRKRKRRGREEKRRVEFRILKSFRKRAAAT